MLRMLGTLGVSFLLSLPADVRAESALAEGLAALHKIDYETLPPHNPAKPLKVRFARIQEMIGREPLARLSDEDIRDYFDASYLVAFYAHDRVSVDAMRSALDELALRGVDSDAQRQNLLDMYVKARRVSDAQAFARDSANARLTALPNFAADEGTPAPKVWRLSDDGTTVERHGFTLGDAPRLIVVSSPWCRFTNDATEAIAKDAELTSLMKRHSTWIMPQLSIPDFAKIAKWNRDYPGWPMQIMYDEADWTMIPTPRTPVFYFFDHGKVAETIVGWPGPEQKDKLRDAFAKEGMR